MLENPNGSTNEHNVPGLLGLALYEVVYGPTDPALKIGASLRSLLLFAGNRIVSVDTTGSFVNRIA